MTSYHKNILKILNFSKTDAKDKYNLHPIETTIDKTCQNLLYKIIQEPDHPLTSNLLKNPRSTSVFNLYKTKIAKTEAHKQTFVLKYLRMLHDKRNDLHKHKNTKRLINSKQQHNTNQTNTIAQLKHKTSHTVTNCLNCGTMVKSKTGLSAHLRFNKRCQKSSVSEAIMKSLFIS